MIAVYPGSFDPATYGHLDIITRVSKMTKKLIVAVLKNPSKNQLLSPEERCMVLKELTIGIPNIEVMMFEGLLVDFCKLQNANVVIRGLRALTDFEYEFQMALTNRSLNEDIETLLIPTSLQYLYLSSSVAKEVFMFGGNIDSMVPQEVKNVLEKIYKRN